MDRDVAHTPTDTNTGRLQPMHSIHTFGAYEDIMCNGGMN